MTSLARSQSFLKDPTISNNVSNPSRVEGGPEGADRGKAHLNDEMMLDSIQIEFFFTNNDCLKVDFRSF